MAFSLSLSRLLSTEPCLASGFSEDGNACKLKGRRQPRSSVFQRVAEKHIARLSFKGDECAFLQHDSAKSASASREPTSDREKLSHNRVASDSRTHSSSLEPEKTDVESEVASSKSESTLQAIFDEFRSPDRRSVLPHKRASGKSVFRGGKDSRTAGSKPLRRRTLPGQAFLDALRVSEDSESGFDDSYNEIASDSERENEFTRARREGIASDFKSNIPFRRKQSNSLPQNGSVRPKRSPIYDGSRSRSSKLSIPVRTSQNQRKSEAKDGAAGSSTSISPSSSRSNQSRSLLKSNKSHDFPELDAGDEPQESSDDCRASSVASTSTSSTSSQELHARTSLQFKEASSFETSPDSGVEEGFVLTALSAAVREDSADDGSLTPPVNRGESLVSSVSEEATDESGVGDVVGDGSSMSTSVVGPKSMSSQEPTFCSEQKAFDSTSLLSLVPDNGTMLLPDNKANTTKSCGVTEGGSFSSVPASSIQLDHGHSTVDSGGACASPTGPAVSQDTVKKRLVWNHPLADLPFELQYSYSETPNERIIGFRRGSQFSPFGPVTRGRPWTGGAPLKPSKKKLPEFDSFNPPPKGKKGVKFVQDPGPYPEGQSPKSAYSREEIMGEPLSREEVVKLVEKSVCDRRQVNLGRDGLTHNMLDVIHKHWQRRRVCRIKCLGVPTVDMDNVSFHVEDKTGGKIIYRSGGVLYLFRGRNYNYRDRPRIPLMLWKPATPVYPKLIEKAPSGLTEEQAERLRIMGRNVVPICKLSKNGAYLNLVNDVRTAFKVDDLVRIDCQGLNPSDFKKIGAKLKNLVPCILLSFENEHILMWKGKDVNASSIADSDSRYTSANVIAKLKFLKEATSSEERCLDSRNSNTKTSFQLSETQSFDSLSVSSQAAGESISLAIQKGQDFSQLHSSCSAEDSLPLTRNSVLVSKSLQRVKDNPFKTDNFPEHGVKLDEENLDEVDISPEHRVILDSLPEKWNDSMEFNAPEDEGKEENVLSDIVLKNEDQTCHETVDSLWQHAFEAGIAIELDEAGLNMDSVLEKSEKLSHSAPPGPAYTRKLTRALPSKVKEKTEEVTQIDFMKIKGLMKKKRKGKRVAGSLKEEVPTRDGIPVNALARFLT